MHTMQLLFISNINNDDVRSGALAWVVDLDHISHVRDENPSLLMQSDYMTPTTKLSRDLRFVIPSRQLEGKGQINHPR